MKKYLLAFLGLTYLSLQVRSQTVLNAQNFSGGLNGGWTSVDNSGINAGKWGYGHNPIITSDYGNFAFNSTTSANGFARIISDGNANALNTDLISPVINCSTSASVGLQFQYSLILTQGSYPTAQVFVSTDNSTWTMVYDALQSSDGSNPDSAFVDISSIAAYQPTVYVKFNYQATNNVYWAVDDISVLSLPDNDAAMYSIDVNNNAGISNNYFVQCTLQNRGGATLSSVTMNYFIDNGAPVSETFPLGYDLAVFGTQSYLFYTPAQVITPGPHTLTIYTSSPNGQADGGYSDDTLTKTVNFFSHTPVKNVFIEEFATAPCGYCPGGSIYLRNALRADGSYIIGVTHHAGYGTDAMTLPDDITLSNAFGTSAPQASIDRVLWQGQNTINIGVPTLDDYATYGDPWLDLAISRNASYFPALSIAAYNTFDSSSRQLNVTINTTFYGAVTGNFKVNCYIVEDSVVGKGLGYDQVTYYNAGPSDTSLNPWYNQGVLSDEYTNNTSEYEDILPGYVHNHVTRDFLGGAWGTGGIIPATTSADSTYTNTYSTTIPAGWRTNHLSLVAFVNNYNSDYTSGLNEVVNAVSMQLNDSGIIEAPPGIITTAVTDIPNGISNVSLYPNPAGNFAYIKCNLEKATRVSFEVYNSLGQSIYSTGEAMIEKGCVTTLNTTKYPSGLYLVAVKEQGKVLQTLKFVINR